MLTQLVVDAACDLPEVFYQERSIKVLPIKSIINGDTYIDDRNTKQLMGIFDGQKLSIKNEVTSEPFTADEIEAHFLSNITPNCDYALMLTTSNQRSPIFSRCEQAQTKIQAKTRQQREGGKRESVFGMRVMNSATMFAGQGVLAAFTSDLINAGKSTSDILKMTDVFKKRIYAYALPADTSYVRERAKKRGEDSIGFMASVLAKSLDIKPIIRFHQDETEVVSKERGHENAVNTVLEYAVRRIESGLICPYVVISHAGNPDAIKSYESFGKLTAAAKRADVAVLTCHMGLAGAYSLGHDAFTLALAAEDHQFSD